MLRHNHYELAFEAYLRQRRQPYVAVNEQKRALMADEDLKSLDFIVSVPGRQNLLIDIKGRGRQSHPTTQATRARQKPQSVIACGGPDIDYTSFPDGMLDEWNEPIVQTEESPSVTSFRWEQPQSGALPASSARQMAPYSSQNWATLDDIRGLQQWQRNFGHDFLSLLVFVHCEEQHVSAAKRHATPVDSSGWFQDRKYVFWAIPVQDFALYMRRRSAKWETVWLVAADFQRLAQPMASFLA